MLATVRALYLGEEDEIEREDVAAELLPSVPTRFGDITGINGISAAAKAPPLTGAITPTAAADCATSPWQIEAKVAREKNVAKGMLLCIMRDRETQYYVTGVAETKREVKIIAR